MSFAWQSNWDIPPQSGFTPKSSWGMPTHFTPPTTAGGGGGAGGGIGGGGGGGGGGAFATPLLDALLGELWSVAVAKRDRAVRAVRAAQRELQDGIDEAQLQNVISGGRHQPATAGRTAARAHPPYSSRLPAYYPAASAASAAAAAAAVLRRSAATAATPATAAATAAAASGAYVTPRAAHPPDWHEQWCASDWSGDSNPLKGPLGSGSPLAGEQQQHWSPQVRGS